jgi:hypothetical protein
MVPGAIIWSDVLAHSKPNAVHCSLGSQRNDLGGVDVDGDDGTAFFMAYGEALADGAGGHVGLKRE